MRQQPGDQVRQAFIENLCRKNIMEKEEIFSKLNYTQKINLELTFVNSSHSKDKCFVRRELQPYVQKIMNDKEKSTMSVGAVQQYLKMAMYQFRKVSQYNPLGYRDATFILNNISKRHNLDATATPFVSSHIKDYILFVLKTVKNDQEQFPYFKKTALSLLDELPAPLLHHSKK